MAEDKKTLVPKNPAPEDPHAMQKMRMVDEKITRIVITFHIAMAIILSVMFGLITDYWLASFIAGSVCWTYLLCKTRMYDMFFINVKPDTAMILGNQMIRDDIPETEGERTKMFHRKSLREVQAGFKGKFPWEVEVESVNIRAAEPIGTKGKPLKVTTQNQIPLEIEWQVILTPLPGYLVNLIRKGDDNSKSFFEAEFTRHITAWVKEKDEKDVYKSALDSDFCNHLGGPDSIHEDEKEYGMFTNKPKIISIDRDKKYQEATQAEVIATNIGNAGKVMQTIFTNGDLKPDPNVALVLASAAAGVQTSGVVIIPGLEKTGAENTTALLEVIKNLKKELEVAKGTKKK